MMNTIIALVEVCLGLALGVVIFLFKDRSRSKKITLESVEKIVEEANFWKDVEKVVKGEKVMLNVKT